MEHVAKISQRTPERPQNQKAYLPSPTHAAQRFLTFLPLNHCFVAHLLFLACLLACRKGNWLGFCEQLACLKGNWLGFCRAACSCVVAWLFLLCFFDQPCHDAGGRSPYRAQTHFFYHHYNAYGNPPLLWCTYMQESGHSHCAHYAGYLAGY